MTEQEDEEVKRLVDILRSRVEWQPIKSAPKDGRRVLITWVGAGHVTIGHYALPENGKKRAWCDDSQPWKSALVRPTHWMPLPLPLDFQSHNG